MLDYKIKMLIYVLIGFICIGYWIDDITKEDKTKGPVLALAILFLILFWPVAVCVSIGEWLKQKVYKK